MNKTINALVVEDQPVYRKGIVNILSGLNFIGACDEAENGQAALDKFENQVYELVFLDINMPVMDGITAARLIKEKYPKTLIIILTMIDSKKQIIELLEMGVNGYLIKSVDEEEIVKALQIIAEGRQYFTEEVYKIWADFLINKSSQKLSISSPQLSLREIEIVKLFCEQNTAKEIADIVCLSEVTINNHRSHIMKKIGVDNIVGVVMYAVKHGLYIP